ncbi:TonB-dependent receptor [Weeksellaceae bacterium KMM 9713]|uniref:TonB-dependent receptor n=1 Tax=Profundicola chukchiensis TaxID=2961959 RepID=A0A9X4N129_9FLAO|nr:TonB-dependent receptor [Profundicola chukchiensis]MDG4947042.1 TonB-dependent receptor [Profundicola chukchiensis]
MSYRILLLFTLCIGCFISGQNIVVKDSLTNIPLEAVLIKSNNGSKPTSTNHLGVAHLPEVLGDSISFYHDKYEPKTIATSRLSKSEQNTIFLQHEIFTLQSVITTGTNWKNNSQKSPIYVSSLSESEIQILNQPTTADLLSQTNEIYVQKSQLGGGSPMIRGFATNRLLLTVDGVNMNNAIFRSGNLQNIIAIDPFTVKNIEVISGPASVLYGSDAIGGVISFETKSVLPTSEFKVIGDASVRYASASEEKTIHADIDISMPKWSSITSITYTDYGDLKMGKHGPQEYLRQHYVTRVNGQDIQVENDNPRIQRETGYNQKNLLQKFHFQPSSSLDLTASFSYSETSDVPRYDRLLRYRGENLRSAEWYYGPQQWLFSNIKADYHQPNLLFDEVQSILSHQYFTESRHDRDFDSFLKNNRFERVNVWGWENAFLKKIDDKNTLRYGTDMKFNYVNSSANIENINTGEKVPGASRYPDGSTWNQYGIYAKYIRDITSRLNIVSGIRYGYVTSKSKFSNEFYPLPFEESELKTGSWTGKVGAYYKPFRQLVLNAQFSTGFRVPNIDDMSKVFDSEPGSVVVPNPDLKPEYIYNIEAGISKSFGNTFYINGIAYYSWLEDALVRRDFTLNGESTMMYDGELSQIQAIQNAASARVYGGMIQMELNISKEFKFLSKVNYTHGEEELDDGSIAPLRHAAPLFGNLGLEYAKNKFKAKLLYQYNDGVKAEDMPPSEKHKEYLYALDENGMAYAPSWNIFNISAKYKLTDYISLHGRVDNIFDHLYRPYSSGISAPGRNFVFSIRTIF